MTTTTQDGSNPDFPVGLSGDLSSTPDQLAREAHYRKYIQSINERRLDDLASFVHEHVTHNGRRMTRTEYRDLLADDVRAFPDLFFELDMVLVTGDRVASRILFETTQVAEWRGKKPDGRRVRFEELVFYRFEGDRIREVWSIVGEPTPV